MTSSERIIPEAERHICRARQLVERQRQLVSKIGKQNPAAVTLLTNFEQSAALLEQALTNYRRSDLLAARMREAIDNRNPGIRRTAPNHLEQASEALAARQAHDEQMRNVAGIVEILREGGFLCELSRETLQ
jgi:hypothetical protein